MEVKARLITSMVQDRAPDVQIPQDSRTLQPQPPQPQPRMAALQDRKRALEALLSSRVAQLRHVCLQEAELTGKLPRAFPLETGERAPAVPRRAATRPGTKTEDDSAQRRQTIFVGASLRHVEAERGVANSKRTVHRGCHTEDAVMSESTSSASESTSHDNDLSQRCLSQPGLSVESPDHRINRKLSPVDIYYEMRTRRNSATSSVRSDGSGAPGAPGLKQWAGSLDVPYLIPLAPEGSSSERRPCPYGSRARRSNSSEALLDRSALPEDPPPSRTGMPPRGGPYKSSETLTDGKLQQMDLCSPERRADGAGELGLSGGGRAAGGGYSELLMDYIWGRQQKLYQSTGRIWQDASSPRSSTAAPPGAPHANGFSHSQVHLPSAAPPYSPMVLRGSQAELRRVKVTRTKSCGPLIPLQQQLQDAILLSAYESPLPASGGATTSSIPNLLPYPPEASGPAFGRRPPQFSVPTPEDSTRSLHKALALEGLRDWYLRNALGYPSAAASKAHESGISRLSHPHPLAHQALHGDAASVARPTIPQSASFHGIPLHGRSMEFSLFQESPAPPEASAQEASADPGTLV